MDKFVVRSKRSSISCAGSSSIPDESQYVDGHIGVSGEKRARLEFKCEEDLINDPALRKSIDDYDSWDRNTVRREYLLRGPCQPLLANFPRNDFGNKSRCFLAEWFKKWEWLEYSVSKDAAFCFWCYLFKGDTGKRFGSDVFVKTGFRNWKKASEKFRDHVGAAGSTHNDARARFFAFKDRALCLTRMESSGNQVLSGAYHTSLSAMVDVVRLLLEQGLGFLANDEATSSFDRGNFLEFLDWYGSFDINVGKALKDNVTENHQLGSPSFQRKVIRSCALETTKAIISDVGDKFFSLLIGDDRDISEKEQLTIIVRYVNDHGVVVERFLGVAQIVDSTAVSLKSGIDDFLATNGLSMSRLRGQGYDGTSNMRDEFNGLKTLISNENPCAMYAHCFTQQLHSVIVAVSLVNQCVSDFLVYLSMIAKMAGSSCKLEDEVLQKQHENMVERLENGEISTARRLIQDTTLFQSRDTSWGSHYTTVIRLLSLWSSTIQVLENVFYYGAEYKTRGVAVSLAEKMESYQFVFVAHFMKRILGLTHILSQFLQQNDLHIIAAMDLLQSTKGVLQDLKENGWDELFEDVNSFCLKNDIVILNMKDCTPPDFHFGHTYYDHFRDGIFGQVIDNICHELENRFNEQAIELLTCMSCLEPKNSFSKFNESKLQRLAELYPQDFSSCDQMELMHQLELWILEMRGNVKFSKLQTIEDLAKKMVEVGYHIAFHLVYRLIELALVLPVASATMPRTFSSIDAIKTELHSKMGSDFSADCLVCYVEKDVFRSVGNDAILQHFQET